MSIEIFSAFKKYSQLRESPSHYKETKHSYLERFLARVSVMFLPLLNIRTIGAVTFAIAWDTFLYSIVTGVSWKQSQVVTDSVIMPCLITRNKLVQILVALIVVSLLLMLLPRVMFFFSCIKFFDNHWRIISETIDISCISVLFCTFMKRYHCEGNEYLSRIVTGYEMWLTTVTS